MEWDNVTYLFIYWTVFVQNWLFIQERFTYGRWWHPIQGIREIMWHEAGMDKPEGCRMYSSWGQSIFDPVDSSSTKPLHIVILLSNTRGISVLPPNKAASRNPHPRLPITPEVKPVPK